MESWHRNKIIIIWNKNFIQCIWQNRDHLEKKSLNFEVSKNYLIWRTERRDWNDEQNLRDLWANLKKSLNVIEGLERREDGSQKILWRNEDKHFLNLMKEFSSNYYCLMSCFRRRGKRMSTAPGKKWGLIFVLLSPNCPVLTSLTDFSPCRVSFWVLQIALLWDQEIKLQPTLNLTKW